MSEEISQRRMVVSALVVVAFAMAVYFTVQWRSQPPPPLEQNKVLLQKIETGR